MVNVNAEAATYSTNFRRLIEELSADTSFDIVFCMSVAGLEGSMAFFI
jgi:hypothetical protein